jgi:hypothetical protein
MNMTKITPLSSDQQNPNGDSVMEFEIEDSTGIGERFLESFGQFIQEKKTAAVTELLKEEFPHLAGDNNFVEKVAAKLGDDIMEEKRFVFLVLNPKLKK